MDLGLNIYITGLRLRGHEGFMRNILDRTPKSQRDEVHPHVKAILNAPDQYTARMLLHQAVDQFEKKAPRAMETLERGFEDATAIMQLPERYRKRLRTTNGVERLNEEIRRRERVIRIFPNRESVIRLMGAYLMEIDEKWSSGRKYLEMEEYYEWRKTNKVSKKVTHLGF